MNNINRVVITGNLTRDPELRSPRAGPRSATCGSPVNTRRKDGEEWVDKPNFFDVTVLGAQGEASPGPSRRAAACAVDGRLEWREWEAQDGGKRQAVDIIADSVQFLNSGNGTTSEREREPVAAAWAPRRTPSSRAQAARAPTGARATSPRKDTRMNEHRLIDQALERLRARDARLRALWQMTVAQRIAAMRRDELTLEQCAAWAARYPEQVPLLNGEFEYLAAFTPEVRD